MGSCVSVHKDPESAMKLRLSFGSKTDKIVIPSPIPIEIEDKPMINVDGPIAEVGLRPQWSPSHSVTTFRDFGSKEETFFDSQAWLESDCEDDFLSVNGDFTPSRGNTPVHHSFSTGTPQVNRALFDGQNPGSKPEPSPTDMKKRLSELFKDSLQSNQDVDEQNPLSNQNGEGGNMEAKATALELLPKSARGTPYVSGANSVCSSERTPNGDVKPGKEKSVRSVQCCLPSLLSTRSFSERRKKMSPALGVGG